MTTGRHTGGMQSMPYVDWTGRQIGSETPGIDSCVAGAEPDAAVGRVIIVAIVLSVR